MYLALISLILFNFSLILIYLNILMQILMQLILKKVDIKLILNYLIKKGSIQSRTSLFWKNKFIY
jgi:hypothetical protein